ncbi:hypothetical protein [Sphingobacterium siyangense]|nr:hypothetical protein [Sphingobacterium siyangense]
MEDWVNSEDFIIVTGLTKDLYDFSFFLDYTRDDFFYQSIKIKFDIEFQQKLVQINLPFTLCKDYISTVPLYHELGHFIEKQFDIALHAFNQLFKFGVHEKPEIIKYFPFIDHNTILEDGRHDRGKAQVFYTHLMEYFCDLFAAQYIGTTSNLYLNSISTNDLISEDHPSPSLRALMVNDFLENRNNLIIDTFNEALFNLTNKRFEKRYSTIQSEDFYHLIPFIAKNDAELHGIFDYGWRIWLADFKPFEPMMGDVENIPGGKIYQIINSLMEKSIGNYFITKEWNSKK